MEAIPKKEKQMDENKNIVTAKIKEMSGGLPSTIIDFYELAGKLPDVQQEEIVMILSCLEQDNLITVKDKRYYHNEQMIMRFSITRQLFGI
jgi:hypothetical protein